MTKEKEYPALPKWPALIVTGKPITEEQAEEVIVRTTGWSYLSTNEHRARKNVYEMLRDRFGWEFTYNLYDGDMTDWEHDRKAGDDMQEALGLLDIEYLQNARVLSSWIGGPHGWCDWNGSVFTNNYNIGKWPSVAEVETEWREIAEAFPFLDLRSWLMNEEASESADPKPVVYFMVKDGSVSMAISDIPEPSVYPSFGTFDVARSFMTPGREIGCDLNGLGDVIQRVLDRVESR